MAVRCGLTGFTIRLCALLLIVSAGMAERVQAASLSASYKAGQEARFQTWIRDLWPEAQRAGVSRSTFDAAFKGVRIDWSLPDLNPPGIRKKPSGKPRRQPEFGSPGRYFGEKNLNALAAIGARHRKKHAALLKRITARYGVPGPIILAVWGRETAYGRAKIPYYAVRSLATLAFIGRRKQFFHPEVIDALKILEAGHVSRSKMKSSWAGAMGHTQMLPGHFLRYAVDFDGDGRRDIWNSIPDALATTAHYLNKKGWKSGRDWGYEVNVPQGVSCAEEGPDRRTAISTWLAKGITRTRDRKFPDHLKSVPASILMPAGRYGPAFLATENFYVIKTYNESDVYALYVGYTADRMYNNRKFAAGWGKVSAYTRAKVKALQKVLIAQGYDPGGADGLIGYKTRVAVGLYQARNGLKVDCWPGPATFRRAGL